MAAGDLPFKSFPNHWADNNLTSTGLAGVGFGFAAAMVRITNNGAGNVYVDPASTGIASTADFQVSSGESLELRDLGVGISGFAWAATSTGAIIRAGAWG